MSLPRTLAIALAVAGTEASGAQGESPYSLELTYTGEVWRNARGGIRRGESYLDNLDVKLTIDAERAWGIPGLELFGYLLHNNGGSVTEDLVGDAQAISNIEALDQVRFYELWADFAFGPERAHSLRFGLYDLNSEFDASAVGELFINSGHGIGTQIGQTGLNGPSIFPVTSLTARLRYQLAKDWTLLAAALDGVPGDPDHPSSNRIHLGRDDGLLLAVELAWQHARVRKLALGRWHYTANFDELLPDARGAPIRSGGNEGAYVLLETNLWSDRAESSRALDAYARIGTANGRINRFDQGWAAGIVATGLLPRRAQDQLGLGVVSARNGSAYLAASGLSGETAETSEYAIELTYRAQITDWLTVQPDVQYVVNPDTVAGRGNALALGLRAELSWSRGQ